MVSSYASVQMNRRGREDAHCDLWGSQFESIPPNANTEEVRLADDVDAMGEGDLPSPHRVRLSPGQTKELGRCGQRTFRPTFSWKAALNALLI